MVGKILPSTTLKDEKIREIPAPENINDEFSDIPDVIMKIDYKINDNITSFLLCKILHLKK